MIYQRIFTLVDAGRIHVLFQELLANERRVLAEQRARGLVRVVGTTARISLIEKAYAEWQRELQTLATVTAARATAHIQERIQATAVRPGTGNDPHLINLIVSRPVTTLGFITGQVGVADEQELDRAVNPYGPQYGPYWKAQEYGNPGLVGRQLFGAFYGAGGSPPGYLPSSTGGNKDPIFITKAQGASPVGRMIVKRAPQARHFIRDGANLALIEWRKGLKTAEEIALVGISAALAA